MVDVNDERTAMDTYLVYKGTRIKMEKFPLEDTDPELRGLKSRSKRYAGGKPGKGFRHGKNNRNAKLTEKEVHNIKAEIRRGVSDQQLAARYSVGSNSIWNIRKGKTWRHV